MDQDFFARDTATVAQELLGCQIEKPPFLARIVETEAYLPDDDPASHAAQQKTDRNEPMFGPPGHAYIYISYGIHTMLNVVTETDGTPGAVLIRSLEPQQGIEKMKQNREMDNEMDLCNGPGRLCEALAITKDHNREPLYTGRFAITDGETPSQIDQTPRIGISDGTEKQLRYIDATSKFLSR